MASLRAGQSLSLCSRVGSRSLTRTPTLSPQGHVVTSVGVLVAGRAGKLLSSLQCAGQPPLQRVTLHRVSVVPRMRNMEIC